VTADFFAKIHSAASSDLMLELSRTGRSQSTKSTLNIRNQWLRLVAKHKKRDHFIRALKHFPDARRL
jgi:hypothetical protein